MDNVCLICSVEINVNIINNLYLYLYVLWQHIYKFNVIISSSQMVRVFLSKPSGISVMLTADGS